MRTIGSLLPRLGYRSFGNAVGLVDRQRFHFNPISAITMLPLLRWLPLVVLVLLVELMIPDDAPAWLLMWCLSFAIFAGCKWLAIGSLDIVGVPTWKWMAFLFAWPGLDAKAFCADEPSRQRRFVTMLEWSVAMLNTAIGAILFWNARDLVPASNKLLLGWIGMVGLILMLHFGAFHLLSCAWRAGGVDAKPLMLSPALATSLSDFWGRRWNTAFRDVTHDSLFRQLAKTVGGVTAVCLGFLFSGLIHDLVISYPARAGYGLPTLYFCIQAVGLLIERSPLGRKIGLAQGSRGWAFTMLFVVGPAFWLFHPPFVTNVIVPFMRAMHAT